MPCSILWCYAGFHNKQIQSHVSVHVYVGVKYWQYFTPTYTCTYDKCKGFFSNRQVQCTSYTCMNVGASQFSLH